MSAPVIPKCNDDIDPRTATGELARIWVCEADATAVGPPPWRATGLETPVFADPSGRRARAMSGVGFVLLATTLAALVLVATAAIGFSTIPAPVHPWPSIGATGTAATGTRRGELAVFAGSRAAGRQRHPYVAARMVDAEAEAALDRIGR